MALTSEHESLTRLERGLAGRYSIEHEIGRGAAARVFLAVDLRHGRKVAVKLLRPELGAVVGGERFLQEIRVTAALQHPHILPLYDSGEIDGLLYYVTPYVAGESLRTRLERECQLSVDEAVALTRTLASALDYAHRQGVIHRDIKPENILLQDGQPLLADFGIALAISSAAGDRLTQTGLSLGTPQYMSPEQATGERTVGPQSDIYSLGAVAYEMLAGEPPVTGPTREAIVARVMLATPRDIRSVRATVPQPVEAGVLKALSKVPADRFRTAMDFAAALATPALPHPPTSRRSPVAARRAFRQTLGAAAALACVAAAFVVARELMRPSPEPASRRQITFSGNALQAAISPDGRFLAYTVSAEGTEHLLVQDVTGGPADTLDTWASHGPLEWSPDGARLLVTSAPTRVVVLRRMGGPSRTIGVARALQPGLFAYWLPDGGHVSLHASNATRILIVNVETEDTVAIALRSDHWSITEGNWSPDGRLFAVMLGYNDPIRYAIATVARDDGHVELVASDSVALGSPRWSSDGRAIYFVRDVFGRPGIRRIGVSPQTGRGRGVAEEIHPDLEALPIYDGFVRFSLTKDGQRAVYARGAQYSNLVTLDPDARGLAPRTNALTSGTAILRSPAVSPDGASLAFVRASHGTAELFKMPAEGGAAVQITSGARVSRASQIAWSPDGSRIAFQSIRGGFPKVWAANVADGRLEEFGRTRMNPYSGHIAWAPASRIAYLVPTRDNFVLLDPASGDERLLLPDTAPGFVFNPIYSPDGRRLAFAWNRPPDSGTWVFDFQDSSYARISEIVAPPRAWSPDGRYVFGGYPTIRRIDSQRTIAPRAIVTSPSPQCTLAGPRRPNGFVCVVSGSFSDIWMIERFDPRRR